MDDATLELELIMGSNVCCNYCGDTGWLWGREECGPCANLDCWLWEDEVMEGDAD